jgi:hypothetical protein
MGETEIITLGDVTWVKMMGRWVQQTGTPSPAPQQAQVQSDELMRQIDSSMSFQEVGREIINGIACRKYTYRGEGVVHLTQAPITGDYAVRGQGVTWVADQPGVPPVMIRNYGESAIKMAGAGQGAVDISIQTELDLLEINQPIAILPPQGVIMTIPAPAAPRLTSTPRPSGTSLATSAPAPTAGVTSPWTDEVRFDKPYDRSWYGTPGVDAKISTTERPGYLRFEAGSGNDLFPGNNFDAPTLWRHVDGDILAETVVEFDPQADYQGAGLFFWQDEENFVRLERCFGGFAGIANGICVVKVQNGEAEVVVSPVEVETAATRVGLRLQYSGNRFSTWWADAPAGPISTWQPLGSFDMPLTPTEQTAGIGYRCGILLVVDREAPVIAADFEYYRARKP